MTRFFWLFITVLASVFMPTSDAGTRTNGWEEIFFKANQAYREGRFQEAIKGYDRLI